MPHKRVYVTLARVDLDEMEMESVKDNAAESNMNVEEFLDMGITEMAMVIEGYFKMKLTNDL